MRKLVSGAAGGEFAAIAAAQRELDRVLQAPPGTRQERLLALTAKYPRHAATWAALAEEHAANRRDEEARAAIRRALEIDPRMQTGLSRELQAMARYVVHTPAAARPMPVAPQQAPPVRRHPRAVPAAGSALADAAADRAHSALDRAMQATPGQRCEQLVALSRQFANHGPIWLALAHESIAARRVEEAVAAYERALTLDPALEAQASGVLDRTYRLHRRADCQAMLRQLPAGRQGLPGVAEPSNAAANTAPRPAARAPLAPTTGPDTSPAAPAPAGSSKGQSQRSAVAKGAENDAAWASIDKALARSLEESARGPRLAALRALFEMCPEHPGVLFHFAFESAVAGHRDDARHAGDRLKAISPQQYRQLYYIADRYFARRPDPGSPEPAQAAGPSPKVLGPTVSIPALPAASDGVVTMTMAATRERLCEQCWSVFATDPPNCPDHACAALRPPAGWPQLPYRFRGKYRFLQRMGRGSMGAVFAVEDSEHPGQRKAVKVMQQGTVSERALLRTMFEQEMRAAGLLGQQAHFIHVSAFDINGPQPFLEMELVSWPTLRAFMGDVGLLSAQQTARLGVAILDGLCRMHEHNMVHRDIKPENLFVQAQGRDLVVKIADLGSWVYDSRSANRAVGIREMLGTVDYMSPEQTRAGPITVAADIHALGSVLWEAFTGSLPFARHGTTAHEQVRFRDRAAQTLPPRPQAMPAPLCDLLGAALAYEPATRPTGADMRRALSAFAASQQQQHSDFQRQQARIRDFLQTINHAKASYGAWRSANAEMQNIESALLALHRRTQGADGDPIGFQNQLNALESQLHEVTNRIHHGHPQRTVRMAVPTRQPPAAKRFGYLLATLAVGFVIGLVVMVLYGLLSTPDQTSPAPSNPTRDQPAPESPITVPVESPPRSLLPPSGLPPGAPLPTLPPRSLLPPPGLPPLGAAVPGPQRIATARRLGQRHCGGTRKASNTSTVKAPMSKLAAAR